jgi:hypothetical protein
MTEELESQTFTVKYSGDKNVIANFDFSDAIGGVKDCVRESFKVLNGRVGEIAIIVNVVESGEFLFTVYSIHYENDKYTIKQILSVLGFLGVEKC